MKHALYLQFAIFTARKNGVRKDNTVILASPDSFRALSAEFGSNESLLALYEAKVINTKSNDLAEIFGVKITKCNELSGHVTALACSKNKPTLEQMQEYDKVALYQMESQEVDNFIMLLADTYENDVANN